MLVAPIFDTPTRSSSSFLYRYILPRMAPPPLIGVLARNPFFSMFVNNEDFILGTGHGSPESYTGQNVADIFTIGSYSPDQVKGKIIKLISCDTGQGLCQDLVNNGAICAMGYDDDLIWVADASYHFNPWDDQKNAGLVMMPIIAGLNCLLDGGTAGESLAVEKAGYLRNMDNAGRSFTRSILKFNYDHAVLFGDPNAMITARPHFTIPFSPPPLLF